MSFLTPLYALGSLAIIAPIIFHLIRRTTRSEVPFSSLIFLTPSPPRLTRRSRLDHWFLLLLRALALGLLAFAFARPFLRQTASLSLLDENQRRIAVLIDTSASMKRGDLWTRAKAKAADVIASCRPEDQVALIAFDETTRPVFSFEQSQSPPASQRFSVAKAQLDGLSPTWAATQLGQALIDAAGAIENVGDAARQSARLTRKIVLISDLQAGSDLGPLGDFEWPSDVELDLQTVAAPGANASIQWLAEDAASESRGEKEDRLRLRVSNDPSSRAESFELTWQDQKLAPTTVYVPPGESRVTRIERPEEAAAGHSLVLKGDLQEFDNTLYLADKNREAVTVRYLGDDSAEDPSGLLYYLARVFQDTSRRTIKVEPSPAAARLELAGDPSTRLVVLAGETQAENRASLREFLQNGGTVLAILSAPGTATTLPALLDLPPIEVADAQVRGDVMLGEIDFGHSLFAPFAGPQFHDFTKIHIWKYRQFPEQGLGDAHVLARYETGDPAIVEATVGKGRLVVLTTSWRQADSQLARSSKFVPLMAALLHGPDQANAIADLGRVHEPIPIPEGATRVRKPDGEAVAIAPDLAAFEATDAPGLYVFETPKGERSVAVNLAPSESKTEPLTTEAFEQYGCRLTQSEAQLAASREAERQLQNIELEDRQKLWRALILIALAVLIVETWLSGWLGRARATRAEVIAS